MLAVHKPTYRPITRCGQDELSVQCYLSKPSGGILFARKSGDEQKRMARHAILNLLSADRCPEPVSVLTMPGLKWAFEAELIKLRETADFKKGEPCRTRIHAIENDRMIYHAALVRMPGMRNPRHVFEVHPSTAFAERAVSGLWIERFYFANVDDLMRTPPQAYDVVWLDYTGPLSIERMRLIRRFWASSVRKLLVITCLKARWNRDTSNAIERAGSLSAWVRHQIDGTVLHDLQYDDGSPMEQFAFARDEFPEVAP